MLALAENFPSCAVASIYDGSELKWIMRGTAQVYHKELLSMNNVIRIPSLSRKLNGSM